MSNRTNFISAVSNLLQDVRKKLRTALDMGLANSLRYLFFKPKQSLWVDLVTDDFVQTSISDVAMWRDFASKASSDSEVFEHFRRYEILRRIVETNDYFQGRQYLSNIFSLADQDETIYPKTLSDLVSEFDSVGSPLCYKYKTLGLASPLALRYLDTALEIKRLFNLKSVDLVVEIGPGFGGLALMNSRLMKVKDYWLIDLPEVVDLCSRFLDEFRTDTTFRDGLGLTSKQSYFDLVISNYAFSEIKRDMQVELAELVLSRSRKGYLVWNNLGETYMGGVTLKEFLSWVPNPRVLSERPLTANGNQIIVWGLDDV